MICCIFNSKDDASFTIQTLETFQNQTISYNHNDLKKKMKDPKRENRIISYTWMYPQCDRVEWQAQTITKQLAAASCPFPALSGTKYELATSPLQDAGT